MPSRATVAGGLAATVMVAAAVAGAFETNVSRWPAGVGVPAVEADGTRTFSVRPRGIVTFPPGVARPGDVVVCEGSGSVTIAPRGVPAKGSAKIEAVADGNGRVVVDCSPPALP